MGNLGMGYMIEMLGGYRDALKAWENVHGKEITRLSMNPDANDGDGALYIEVEGGVAIEVMDKARSCCESRYLECDDDLGDFIGGDLLDIEVSERPSTEDEDGHGVVECAFMVVRTSIGAFTVSSYNRHNGYYGGIFITVRSVEPYKEDN